MGEATWSRLRWPRLLVAPFVPSYSNLLVLVTLIVQDWSLTAGRDHLVNVARETHANLTRRRSVGWSRLNSCPASRFAAHRGERERKNQTNLRPAPVL